MAEGITADTAIADMQEAFANAQINQSLITQMTINHQSVMKALEAAKNAFQQLKA